ncbi:hypothetical protein KCP76_15840 [Salmonella enterica subsp. enterica serovar Weltevreden]|nr:hypothetical protein KCP76_15840 [Salmonella enterica subsp. enterica serovar Weltevreden]
MLHGLIRLPGSRGVNRYAMYDIAAELRLSQRAARAHCVTHSGRVRDRFAGIQRYRQGAGRIQGHYGEQYQEVNAQSGFTVKMPCQFAGAQ